LIALVVARRRLDLHDLMVLQLPLEGLPRRVVEGIPLASEEQAP
jgi:hypothetical protein